MVYFYCRKHPLCEVQRESEGEMDGHTTFVCDNKRFITSRGVWLGDNPMEFAVPLLACELLVVTLTCRAVAFLSRPLKVARVASDIVACILLGPSVLGRISRRAMDDLFPKHQRLVMEVLGDLAVIFWFFLMGIQVNLCKSLKRLDKKSMAMAVVNNVSAMAMAHGCTYLINYLVPKSMECEVPPISIGVYLGIPTVSVLADTVVQHKVMETVFGKLALTTGVNTQLMLMLTFHFFLAPKVPGKPLVFLWVGFSGIALALSTLALSRLLLWRIRNEVKEYYVFMILLFVVVLSLVSDMLGLRMVMGAFLAGLVMPSGLLAESFNNKLEDIVTFLLPLILVLTGQGVDFSKMFRRSSDWALVLILVTTYVGKNVIDALTARCLKLTLQEGCLVGMLLTSKGIVDAIVLHWTTRQSVDSGGSQIFAIMVVGIVVINLITSFTVRFVGKAPKASHHMSCRAVQHLRSDAAFQILACIHEHQMVPTLIRLLESTRGSQKSPINVFTLHLLHATARESNMLYLDALSNNSLSNDDQNRPVQSAFNNHQWINENVIVEHYARISPYSTMHEDVINVAIEKSAVLIIIPFHKEILETAESSSKALRLVNENILANAPCSVAILAHRGLIQTRTNAFRNVAVLFFGGPDDREALAYAARIAKQEGVNLTVVRFLLTVGQAPTAAYSNHKHVNSVASTVDRDREKVVDDYCIGLFQMEVAGDSSVSYNEIFVTNGAETIDAIQSIKDIYDLFVVGRHHESSTVMMSGMEQWNEYQELGPMGDLLTSPDFGTVSVLVIQQHVWRKDIYDNNSSTQEDKKQFHVVMRQEFSQAKMTSRQTTDLSDHQLNWQLHSGF
ncbi:cation/H(+) antiporter 15-like [Nymphaea colorata]|nr:cation/H(+) antiporter 15-like [Nymphaea colorata]